MKTRLPVVAAFLTAASAAGLAVGAEIPPVAAQGHTFTLAARRKPLQPVRRHPASRGRRLACRLRPTDSVQQQGLVRSALRVCLGRSSVREARLRGSALGRCLLRSAGGAGAGATGSRLSPRRRPNHRRQRQRLPLDTSIRKARRLPSSRSSCARASRPRCRSRTSATSRRPRRASSPSRLTSRSWPMPATSPGTWAAISGCWTARTSRASIRRCSARPCSTWPTACMRSCRGASTRCAASISPTSASSRATPAGSSSIR